MLPTLKRRLYVILEAGHTHDAASRIFEASMATLIIANVVAFSLETAPAIGARYKRAFELFDIISVAIFTIEYLLRLWVCTEHKPFAGLSPLKARARHAMNPFMIIDFIAIAPFYLAAFFALDLRVFRVFRLLRFFKLARFSSALNTMIRVLINERAALSGVAMIMVGLLIVSSSVLYIVEGQIQPDAFGSVPLAMWWAISTLTTVGYGDVTPVTALGKMLAGVVMIFGLGVFALPIGIVASGFLEEFRRREFIVSWGMAARAPVFSDLSAEGVADLLTVLRARAAPAGAEIVVRGDRPGALYVVASGEVEVEENGRVTRITEGGYWGATSLLSGEHHEHVQAVTNCDLLVLDQDDFRELGRKRPSAHDHILAKIAGRLEDVGQAKKTSD